jgi:hypothetical protein
LLVSACSNIYNSNRKVSKVMNVGKTIWQKVEDNPCEKACQNCQTLCEGTSQCTCQSGESCLQQCGNCLSLCQNNQGSEM